MTDTMIKEETKKLICIRCPVGCDIEVFYDENHELQVAGNTCALGKEYALTELSDPKRIITSTVKVKGGRHSLVSVWTTDAVPKDRVMEVMEVLRTIEVQAPVEMHDIIVKNVLGLGVDIEASESMQKA